ncbi:MAG: hypothetical protein ACJAV6_000542 [Candidatus Paceibacteria bacterium]|jgi:hypothetical protein
MDFNINTFLKNKITENKTEPVYLLGEILKVYDSNILTQNISFSKGRLSLKNISPQLKLHITMNKNMIIEKAKEQGVELRDIM